GGAGREDWPGRGRGGEGLAGRTLRDRCLGNGRDDVDRRGACHGDRVAAAAVLVGGLGLCVAGVARLRAAGAVVRGALVRALELVVGLPVHVLAGAVARAAVALRTGGARVGLRVVG